MAAWPGLPPPHSNLGGEAGGEQEGGKEENVLETESWPRRRPELPEESKIAPLLHR